MTVVYARTQCDTDCNPYEASTFHRRDQYELKEEARVGFQRTPKNGEIYVSRWRRGSESNRRMRLLQSPALPLGYPAIRNREAKFVLHLKQVQVLPATVSTGETQLLPVSP